MPPAAATSEIAMMSILAFTGNPPKKLDLALNSWVVTSLLRRS